jgi:hypothetical protein
MQLCKEKPVFAAIFSGCGENQIRPNKYISKQFLGFLLGRRKV